MTDTLAPWTCDGCGRSPPAVSFPVIADTPEWVCRECRADRWGTA